MPHGPLKIKEKGNSNNAPPLDNPNRTVKLYQAYCHYVVNAAYTSSGQVQLPHTPPLFQHAYRLNAAVRWMLAGLLPLNQYTCRSFENLIMHARWCGASLSLYLLVCCLTISHACWCLTTGHAVWCGVSLSAMYAGVVPRYRP